jgi:hypothetical protein
MLLQDKKLSLNTTNITMNEYFYMQERIKIVQQNKKQVKFENIASKLI